MGAVRAGEPRVVPGAGQAETAVDQRVVVAAEEDEVVDVGVPVVDPMNDVMGVTPAGWSPAAWEPAMPVSGDHCPAHRLRDGSGGTTDVERLCFGGHDDSGDRCITRQTMDQLVRQNMVADLRDAGCSVGEPFGCHSSLASLVVLARRQSSVLLAPLASVPCVPGTPSWMRSRLRGRRLGGPLLRPAR